MENMIEFLKEQKTITLATNIENQPMTHPVSFVNEDEKVYFCTNSATTKIRNLQINPNVAFSTFRESPDHMSTKSLQVQGKASLVTEPTEVQRIMGLMLEKHPFMKSLPNHGEMAMVKIEPTSGYLMDNSKGFGNKEIFNF